MKDLVQKFNQFRSGGTHSLSKKTISFSGWQACCCMTQNTFYVKNQPVIQIFFNESEKDRIRHNIQKARS